MPPILTPQSLAAELKRRQKLIHTNTVQKMKLACANVEGTAKVYCTPGESPYPTAPYKTGFMRSKMASAVEDKGATVEGLVGNSASYAAEVHEGNSRMGGRPFILDAIRAEKDKTTQILGSAVSEGCR